MNDNKNMLNCGDETPRRDDLAGMANWLRRPAAWLILVLTYVLYTRAWGLADKVMHHDESLFAYYGYWLYKGNGYDYQPILHGPVLQFLSAFFFLLFGDDQWTMRLPSLLGGLLMFPVAWCWRRYIGGAAGAVALSGLIALSPSIAFYTRFLRNDVPYLTATMWCAYCLLRAMQSGRPRYVWGALLGATLMFCMMESSIFFFAACIGYLTTMVLVDLTVWRRWRGGATRRLGMSSLLGCLAASAVAAGIVGWLFHRVLSASLPLYAGVKDFVEKHGINVSVTGAAWMLLSVLWIVALLIALLVAYNWNNPRGRHDLLRRFCRVVWVNRWHVVGALAAAVIIYTTLFTTFFTFRATPSFDHDARDFRGPTEMLTPVQIYKNTWDYWWDQHKEHRIKGPFHYYLPIMLLYELPILCLVALGWLRGLRRTRDPWLHGAVLLAMHAGLALILFGLAVRGVKIDWKWMDAKLHVTSTAHLFMILLYAQLLVYVAPLLYRQGRRVESFVTYWGVTALFAYSYAGEKVPWLTVHTVGPLSILAAFELVRLWKTCGWRVNNVAAWRKVAFAGAAAVAVLYQVRNNHLLLIVHPWSPAERLVYNHTSPDMQETVDIVDRLANETNFGPKLPMLIDGEMGWPLHWYLRDYTNFTAPAGETAANTTRPLVMVDWHRVGVPNIVENYAIRRMKVREWWEPELLDFGKMADIYLKLTPLETRREGPMADRYRLAVDEWRKLWRYLAYREIWLDPANPTWTNGANEFALCIRRDVNLHLMSYQWLVAIPKRPDVPTFIP